MKVMVETVNGPKAVNVCDGCRTVCVALPQRFCSERCARAYFQRRYIFATPTLAAGRGAK